MSDPLNPAPLSTAGADATQLMGNALAGSPAPAVDPAAAMAIISHPVTAAVIQSVHNDPNVQPSHAADVAANVLQALMPLVQPVEDLSRASVRQRGYVAIGFAALSALLSIFYPHPALSNS